MRARAALPAALLLALAACDETTGPAPIANPAFLRVVNASPATTSVDVVVGERTVARDVAFGTASAVCVQVPSDAPSVVLRSGGQTVATAQASFTANRDYMV